MRDKLAELLAAAFVHLPEYPKPVLRGPYATEYWLRVADECIRQMEWAKLQGRRDETDPSGFPQNTPLGLAPEDWKP